MMVGDIVEAVLKGVIKESGIEGYESSQKLSTQLGKHTITGEADLTFEVRLMILNHVQTMLSGNKFVSWPSLKDRDSFGYVTQLHVYASATGKPAGGIWALNVATGELNRIESTDTDADVKIY